ncbi:MAG: hypothetical protein HQL14_00810 [Candidatus Omnitrophica bacterium]|nr:hypothetical protein [Candidatus Omnitrophota bacterium]
MKKKTASTLNFENFKDFEKIKVKIKDFWNKQPVLFVGLGIGAIILFCWFLQSLEIFPEGREPRAVQRGVVIEKGDSMIWIGMEVAPVSRNIRKDFKIPGNIKGMFVIDEGKELAQKYGVKTGDVILSVSRKNVRSTHDFINVVNKVQYREGILLEIYRDGNTFYMTIPFEYQYGPLMGPNKGSWQMGSPAVGQAVQYGPIFR